MDPVFVPVLVLVPAELAEPLKPMPVLAGELGWVEDDWEENGGTKEGWKDEDGLETLVGDPNGDWDTVPDRPRRVGTDWVTGGWAGGGGGRVGACEAAEFIEEDCVL